MGIEVALPPKMFVLFEDGLFKLPFSKCDPSFGIGPDSLKSPDIAFQCNVLLGAREPSYWITPDSKRPEALWLAFSDGPQKR